MKNIGAFLILCGGDEFRHIDLWPECVDGDHARDSL